MDSYAEEAEKRDESSKDRENPHGRGERYLLRIQPSFSQKWCDKTMSVLREQQLEACQERLMRCPVEGLFDALCEDEYQKLFQASYYVHEIRGSQPTMDAMRLKVLTYLPEEVCFLSDSEDALVKRMLMNEGATFLNDWDEVSAAESLVKRLWCTVKITKNDTAMLKLQPNLMLPITESMLTSRYIRLKARLFSFDATIHSLLYLSGFLHSAAPVEHLLSLLSEDISGHTDLFIARHLRSSFDYTETKEGEILLLHPGLADPEPLLSSLSHAQAPETVLTQEMMIGGMNGILPEEVASCEAMRGALQGAVRPEYDEEEALEDLRMMAKQGAALSEMREVMESMLCVIPTPRMVSALSQLHLQTVRWMGMPSAVLN